MSGIDLSEVFGRIIRRRRKKLGFSQEELAHRAGLSRNYVSMLELGRGSPTLNVIAMLARALETTLTSLARALDSGK